jgi:hypothetical protein
MAKTNIDINQYIIDEIKESLQDIGGWGSIEIFVQDHKVTQLTKRAIKKTNHPLEKTLDKNKKIL